MAARGPVAAHRSTVGSRPTRLWGKPLGIIHVLITSQATIDRLAQQPCQKVPRVLAAPQIRSGAAAQISQAKDLVQLPVGQELGVGGYLAAMEFELQATVEIDPQMRSSGVTRRVRRTGSVVV